ncbi:MAG: DUF6067 family protein [Verrucomicrobiae bacterium]|nr:DUF6067 family protein [Verrucomicrobiae bacterium]
MSERALLLPFLLWLYGAQSLFGSILQDSSYGWRLPGLSNVDVWWCEATWKVGQQRALPQAASDSVQIEAARNEYEPFQLVIRAGTAFSNVNLSVTDFVKLGGPTNAIIAASNIEACIVEYVPVQFPTDNTCVPGDYPDPLVPITGPFNLPQGTNLPIWFTVRVPREAQAGTYQSTVTIWLGTNWLDVPVRLRVFDFTLSDTTHTPTAYNVELDNRWHALTTAQQSNQVWDLYMQNMRAHRVSPYMPHMLSQIGWSISTDGSFTHDFSSFNAAMQRYLDEFNFTSFKVLREPWTLLGHARFSPEYNRLFGKLMQPITAYLRERGWLDKAYSSWIDEPQRTMLDWVAEGMRAHLLASPELRRLLTFYPDPVLYGHVDVWVAYFGISVFDMSYHRWAERKSAGDEIWCYVAMYPKAPAANNFIDHPAITHRIRAWAMERFGVSGDLYWNISYWKNRIDGAPRNPWAQTTSFDERGQPEGNGDGVLVYPPTKTPPNSPVISGPINSLRWELIREGLEDREYFWLLKELISIQTPRLGPTHPAIVEARAAYAAAMALCRTVLDYERDPRNLYLARRRVAEAIEALETGEPRFVRHPTSRAASLGEAFTLYSEAIGWPPPSYQWQLNGTNLPGATNFSFTVSNANLVHIGDYTVVAENQRGRATSAVARIRGRWLPAPQIVTEPKSAARFEGEHAVMYVTAVSTNACAYQWFKDGAPVMSVYGTNAVLLITNLAPSDAGLYWAIVSNVAGVVTTAPARLVVLSPPYTNSLLQQSAHWLYHDRGIDLGTNWMSPNYDDSEWGAGPGPLGYGTGRESTVICAGLPQKPPTVYFRHRLYVPVVQPNAIILARLRCDDGAVVYLNGRELFRFNMPAGPVRYETSATTPVEGGALENYVEFVIPNDLLHQGTNVLAVELHQYGTSVAPIAFWTLDEQSGPWRDSIMDHHFTAVGTNLVWMPGKFDGCLSNAGSAVSWIETRDRPTLRITGPFTVGGWFAVGYGGGNDPFSVCLEKTNEFRLYYTGTAVNRYRFRIGQTEVQDQTSIAMGRWYLVLGWYDGTNAYIQVNTNQPRSVAVSLPSTTTNPVVSLKRGGVSGGFAADELFFFGRAITPAERKALYEQGLRFMLTNTVEDMLFDFSMCIITAQPPVFTESPTNLILEAGRNAALQLNALSRTAISYQWLFNGTPIPGATNALLFLPNVSAANSGLYALVASNVGGAVTSSPARVIVFSQPEIYVSRTHTGKEFLLTFQGPGIPTELQVSTNLSSWSAVCKLPPSTNAICVVVPVEEKATAAFYRLKLLPEAIDRVALSGITELVPFKLVPEVSLCGSYLVIYALVTQTAVCLETSSDFMSWHTGYCLPNFSGLLVLINPLDRNCTSEFYRLVTYR